jgi:hypothetical protein
VVLVLGVLVLNLQLDAREDGGEDVGDQVHHVQNVGDKNVV